MTREEFAIIVDVFRKGLQKLDFLSDDASMDMWFMLLGDIPYNVMSATARKWVTTNKWLPSIAELRSMSAGLTEGEPKDWGEAWEEVMNAVRYHGIYREKEALASLDDTTRACVQSIGFQNICMSENVSVERASFRNMYQSKMERKKQETQLPPKLSQIIGDMKLIEKE